MAILAHLEAPDKDIDSNVADLIPLTSTKWPKWPQIIDSGTDHIQQEHVWALGGHLGAKKGY